ncbi:MAG TPA: hypothetical protein VNY82_16185 [Steroidobacteraceae bacterium]|nr:hypothetical protein [Steroidobacteraceae bacterium]
MEIRARAIALALMLCPAGAAVAGVDSWTSVGPSGGQIQKVAYNPANPSLVYMISTGGFSRSQDGGATWRTIRDDFQNFPQDLAVDPSDSTRVYVVVPNAPYVLMSTDSGATLSPVTSFPTTLINTWRIQVSQDGATVCVTGGLNIACSVNHAQTWSVKTAIDADPTNTGRVNKLLIDPTDSQTLYASAGTAVPAYGFYVTHDGATTWQKLVATTNSNSVAWDLAYSPGSPATLWAARYDGVWYSNNGGAQWIATGFNSPGYGAATTAIAVSPLNPGLVYVGTPYGEAYTLTNGGSTWINISGNSLVGQTLTVVPHPTQSATLLAGGYGGLWGTSDGGTTWSETDAGLLAANVSVLSADSQSDRIYIGTSTGGLYSLAGGAVSATPANNTSLAALAQEPHVPLINAVLAQNGSPGPLWVSMANGIAKSTDGGTTWSLLPLTSVGNGQADSLASSPAAPQIILSGGRSGIYRSTDGGTTWAGANTGFPSGATVQDLVMAAADPTIAYCAPLTSATSGSGVASSYGVYRSTDAGQTWSPANATMTSSYILGIVVDPTNAQVVYASTDSGVLKSTDGGTSWAPLLPFGSTTSPSGYFAVDPVHPRIVYAATYGKVSRSVDGGTTWETVLSTQPAPQWLVTTLLVDPNRTSNLLVATQQAGVQEITIAPDLGLAVAAPSGTIAVGATATYQYTVTNKGPFSATDVQVTLQLPSSATGITAIPSTGSCSVTGTNVTCTLGTLGNGTSASVTLSATSTAAGAFQVTGTVQSDQPDSNTTNNGVTTNTAVAILADLSVSVTGTAATVQEGAAVSYTVTVANAGPDTAPATQLTYQLGSGLTPGTVSAGSGSCTINSSALVTCTLGDVAVKQSVSVTINATASTAGTATSTAAVTTTGTDPASSNNSATATITVTPIVTDTAPPPNSGGGHGGGGSMGLGGVLGLALALLARQRRLHGTPPVGAAGRRVRARRELDR